MYKSTTQVLVHMNMNMNKTRDSSPWHYWTESWCPDLHVPTTPDDTARAAGIDPQTHSLTPVKTKRQQLKAVNIKCSNKILCCHCHVLLFSHCSNPTVIQWKKTTLTDEPSL